MYKVLSFVCCYLISTGKLGYTNIYVYLCLFVWLCVFVIVCVCVCVISNFRYNLCKHTNTCCMVLYHLTVQCLKWLLLSKGALLNLQYYIIIMILYKYVNKIKMSWCCHEELTKQIKTLCSNWIQTRTVRLLSSS